MAVAPQCPRCETSMVPTSPNDHICERCGVTCWSAERSAVPTGRDA